MGSSLSTGNLNYSESDDPWWALENDNYILDEPSLSEIHSFLQECGGSLKEKVKVINKNLYSKDQCASVNQTVAEKVAEEVSTVRNQTLDEFKEELRKKRMATQSAISDLRSELASLRQQLAEEREISRRLRCGETVPIEKKDAESSTTEIIVAEIQPDEGLSTSGRLGENSRDLKSQLAEAQLALQLANAENLSLTTELGVIRKQVSSLKEVIACSKQMIEVREVQVNQLKAKLQQIEDSLAERELRIMSDNLRQEYDRQLANIRNLRQLYEERARVCAAERENLLRQISIKKDELTTEAERVKNLEERIASLEDEVENSNKKIYELNLKCDEFKFENKSLKEEMEVVNKLFSQMLMGFNGTNNLDIDSLTTMLEENRSLLNEMATKEGTSDGASLPKLLFDIVRQAYTEDSGTQPAQEKAPCNELNVAKVATTQEIIGNLPKVWRVLMELLNHHKIERVQFQENGQSEDCYKSVQTPSGPKAELSVSKTYIKLKDLILEKKALQKETNKLKTLNTHLERRLNDQEKRLSTVSLELTKTWHLVGKMQRQHRQLHTNEQILRYQLQQKRRLLNELKDELEYCRRKWAAARAKNDESQLQCEDLRKEFAKRKLEDANNSAESGYSDGPASDEDDEQPVVKRAYSAAFTNLKKVERTSSASPTRTTSFETMPREKSAPPMTTLLTELTQIVDEIAGNAPLQNVACSSIVLEKPVATISQIPSRGGSSSKSGTVPKQGVRLSREKKLEKKKDPEEESLEEMFYRLSGTTAEVASSTDEEDNVEQDDRTQRIHRLEDQCKTLIAQVIETSENREKLEIQICRFQNEVPPAQRPQCLQDYMVSKYCASDAKQDPFPETSDLLNRATNTADKRDERLKLLEAESNQLMNRIKKTSDRSKRMKTRLEKIHSRCLSREGSAESMRSIGESSSFGQASGSNGVESAAICDTGNDKIGEESKPFTENSISSQTVQENNQLPREIIQITDVEGSCSESDHLALSSVSLTPSEQAGLIRRDDRLKRLEEEGKQLLSKLTSTNNRGSELSSRLDEIHEQASSRVTEEKPSESGQGSSENGASNAESETKTVLEKLEEVKQRLEKSKKLLSQLSSEPDPDINFTRRSVTNSRTQSESDSEGVVHGVRSRTTSSHDATESNLQKGDESSEDQSNNPEPQDGTGTQ